MAHDSRCATASTDVHSCDCECGGRLHGIGDGNSDHQTQQITEEEQRIDEEFIQRFQPEDERQLRQNADMAAFERFVEEKPELADKLQEAEDDPDLDFEVGDIYWEKDANGDRMNVIVPGIGDADEDRREKIRDGAYEYMERKKAKQYEKKENRLRELDKVATDKDEFPEMDHIQTSIDKAREDPDDPTTGLYEAEHRFGDLYVKRKYGKSEDGEKLYVDTRYINSGNYDFENQSQDVVKEISYSHDMNEIDDVEEFVTANHNGDPQEEFRSFGE